MFVLEFEEDRKNDIKILQTTRSLNIIPYSISVNHIKEGDIKI